MEKDKLMFKAPAEFTGTVDSASIRAILPDGSLGPNLLDDPKFPGDHPGWTLGEGWFIRTDSSLKEET